MHTIHMYIYEYVYVVQQNIYHIVDSLSEVPQPSPDRSGPARCFVLTSPCPVRPAKKMASDPSRALPSIGSPQCSKSRG